MQFTYELKSPCVQNNLQSCMDLINIALNFYFLATKQGNMCI